MGKSSIYQEHRDKDGKVMYKQVTDKNGQVSYKPIRNKNIRKIRTPENQKLSHEKWLRAMQRKQKDIYDEGGHYSFSAMYSKVTGRFDVWVPFVGDRDDEQRWVSPSVGDDDPNSISYNKEYMDAGFNKWIEWLKDMNNTAEFVVHRTWNTDYTASDRAAPWTKKHTVEAMKRGRPPKESRNFLREFVKVNKVSAKLEPKQRKSKKSQDTAPVQPTFHQELIDITKKEPEMRYWNNIFTPTIENIKRNNNDMALEISKSVSDIENLQTQFAKLWQQN